MHIQVGEMLHKIYSQVCVNPNKFHMLVEVLNEDLAWRDYAHRLLIEYYKVTPTELQIEVCQGKHTKMQILQLGLKQMHKHDIKLKLMGTTHVQSEMSGLIFGVNYRVIPPDDNVKIEQISIPASQVEVSVWRSNPYKSRTILFQIEEVSNRTGPLKDAIINCTPCRHKIPRLVPERTMPRSKILQH